MASCEQRRPPPRLPGGPIAMSLAAFVLTYLFVFGAGSYYILRLIGKGPAIAKRKPMAPTASKRRPLVTGLVSEKGGRHV